MPDFTYNEDQRFFWTAPYGLTEEDIDIIRKRGIPMVDQERQIYHDRVDHPYTIAKQILERRVWRKRRTHG